MATNPGPSDERKRELKRRLKVQEKELRLMLLAWDPIGLSSFDDDWPEDEYDCLLFPLIRRLEEEPTERKLAQFLRQEVQEHFGLGSQGSQRVFAKKLIAWYEVRSAEGFQ